MIEDHFIEQKKRLSDAFEAAMADAIKAAGTQKKLAEQTGIHQSRISEYSQGNYDFSNLTVGTLIKLFPNLDIVYNINETEHNDEAITAIEQRLLTLFRRLSINDKIMCYENVAKTYGDTFGSVQQRKERV